MGREERMDVRFRESSRNRRRRTEEGASSSSARVRSRTAGSDTFRSRGGGLDAVERGRVSHPEKKTKTGWTDGKYWTRYKHKTNLIGLTSSRKASRTNPYTERILSLDGNVFSSCVRSGKRTLIVVYRDRQNKNTHCFFFLNSRVTLSSWCWWGRRRTLGQRSRLAFTCSSR